MGYLVCVLVGLIVGSLIGIAIGSLMDFDWDSYFRYKLKLKENATKEMEMMQEYLKAKE